MRRLLALTVLSSLLLGCTTPGPTPTAVATATSAPASATATESATPTEPPPTATSTATAPPTVTPPAPTPASTSTPVDTGLITGLTETIVDNPIDAVFWADDGSYVAIAMRELEPSTGIATSTLDWAAYYPLTNTVAMIASPLAYDRSVWQRLHIPDPTRQMVLPELRGWVSPTGQHVIFTLSNTNDCFAAEGKTLIWLADLGSDQRRQLAERYACGSILQAAWLNDESAVVFDFGYEGPRELWLAEVNSGSLTLLDKLTGRPVATDAYWTLSSTGQLAILNSPEGYALEVIDLATGSVITVTEAASWPSWSGDGDWLYYWNSRNIDQAYEGEVNGLRAYQVSQARTVTIIDRPGLDALFAAVTQRPDPADYGWLRLAVSPDGSQVIFWTYNQLWLADVAH